MPGANSNRRCVALVAAALVVGFLGSRVSAAELDQPAITTSPTTPSYSVITYGTRNPQCRQWTDRCVICTLNGCSNIGIACQPQDVACIDPPPEAGK